MQNKLKGKPTTNNKKKIFLLHIRSSNSCSIIFHVDVLNCRHRVDDMISIPIPIPIHFVYKLCQMNEQMLLPQINKYNFVNAV